MVRGAEVAVPDGDPAVEVTRVDVAIIGGGPAGSLLASLLSARGASTLLVDRDTFPRDKVCGEFLSYDALPLLDEDIRASIDDAGAPRIERVRLVGRKHSLEFRLPAAARGVSRRLLDNVLIEHARKAGATILEGCTANAIERGGATTRLTLEQDGQHMVIEAVVVAGAWGRWGRFDQQMQRSFVRDRRTRSFGFKRHYVAHDPPPAVDSIDLYSFDRGYLGVNRVEEGATNICGLVHAARLSGHKGRWDAFVETLRDEQPRLETLFAAHTPVQSGFLASEPVIFRARSPVEHGVFMTGDASGIVDPLTGNGMAMAIQSAWLAVPSILSILADPSQRFRAERRYRAAHHRLFASRIRWSRAIAALLARPEILERAVATIGRPAIGEMLVRKTRATARQVEQLRRPV